MASRQLVVPPPEAMVLAALARDHHPSVRSLQRATGLTHHQTWHALLALREEGMVTWDSAKAGTMRPTFAVKPIARIKRRH